MRQRVSRAENFQDQGFLYFSFSLYSLRPRPSYLDLSRKPYFGGSDNEVAGTPATGCSR